MKAMNDAAPFRKLPDGASSPIKWEASFDKDELKVGVSLRRFDSATASDGLSYPAIFNPVAQADVDLGPYMADLQRRVKRAWFPPKGCESDRVVIVFRVDRDGNPHDTHVKTSSGVAECDEAALRAVDSAKPFRKLPEGARKDIGVQFTFDYNVFTGGGGGAFTTLP
jgi:TonB family protein